MSELWQELILPAELTGYARESLAQYEQSLGTLAHWLPNRLVPDLVARFFVGRTGLTPVASFRAFDAETPLGSLQGLQRMTVELPALGQKNRVGEYDLIRQRNGDMRDTVVLNSVLRITDGLVRAISDRLEYERGQAIENAALNINDNGFLQSADWARSSSHNVTADWSDPNASIIDKLDAWRTLYIADNGVEPGALVTSTKVVSRIARSTEFRNLQSSLVGAPTIVTRESVNSVMASFGLPQFTIYDRQLNYGGTVGRVLSDNKVFMLPAAVNPNDDSGTQFGATFWGQTLEADEPDYGLESAEAPGIVAATWKSKDPIGLWVHAAAIGLPVIANADLSIAATVLPDGS